MDKVPNYNDISASSGCINATAQGVLKHTLAERFEEVTSTMRRWVNAVQEMLNKESL